MCAKIPELSDGRANGNEEVNSKVKNVQEVERVRALLTAAFHLLTPAQSLEA
jgi:hypothetical protein